MPTITNDKNISVDKVKKEITVTKTTTEIFNKKEAYNAYKNLQNQLTQFIIQKTQIEKTIKNIQDDMKELRPFFIEIKDEVELEMQKTK